MINLNNSQAQHDYLESIQEEPVRAISQEYERQLCAWQRKIDELGQDVVRRINKYYKRDIFTYDGGAWIKWPMTHINDVLFSVTPVTSIGLKGKPILSLRQQHNGVPGDTIEVILQTTDKNIATIAQRAVEKFNEKEGTSFRIAHYSGSRMDAIKYSRG